jgi:PAS domain S-box-containing protein
MPGEIKQPVILVVDDDQGLLFLIEQALRREKWTVATASSGAAALEWLSRNSADLMLLDLKLADIGARELVARFADAGRPAAFIIITGQGDERVAVEMMKRGALDYLVKNVDFLQFVPGVVQRALDHLAKEKRLAAAEEALRRSEANLARAQEIAHVGGYEINMAGTGGDHWSEESFRILGLDPVTTELTPSEYILRCVHPDDQARVREAFDKSRNERIRFDLEYRIVRPDGSIRHVHSIVEPVPGADEEAVRLAGTLQDITERKELEKEILEISEREQNRIGQDLHDGLCQHLAGIEFRLLDLKQSLQGKSNKQAAETTELAKLVREGIEQTRKLAHGLSPVMLRADGLMTALQELAMNTEQSFRISCSFNCPAPVLIHDNAVATHLYRIAQEAIQNAIRHGQAKFIVINLLTQNDRIVLGVNDDGVGFPKKPGRHKGIGLRIMQYRAGMVGGSLVVQHELKGGTSVVCSLRAGSVQETARPKDKQPDV